jgi:alpha-galactosidase
MLTIELLSLLLLPQAVVALDNGLGLTPPMGFNTWNKFACDIHEDLVKGMADAMVDSGLHNLGYKYINLDDCWAVTRNETGYIVEDSIAFPSGMAALVDYVHGLKLKFGLYSDSGVRTCAIRPGSLGYEVQDATMYERWRVDYLKVPIDNAF